MIDRAGTFGLGMVVLGLAAFAIGSFRHAKRRGRLAPRQPSRGDAGKDLFIALLSHEVRSSLTAMIGWLEIGRSRVEEPATVRRAFDVALRNALQQARMMDDVLDLSRMQAGKLSVERRPLDLSQVACEAIEAERPAVEHQRIELRPILQNPVFVEGDRGRLAQLVANLLDNAVKFNHSHGWIDVALERCGGVARLTVADNGAGIEASALPHIFDPFWQAPDSGAVRRRGLGLGLALARYIVDLHGGRIEAHSGGPGKGCRFVVELPAIANAEAAFAARNARRANDEEPQALNGLGVVAVDDNEDTLSWLQHLLAMHGAMAWQARSVDEAVMLAKRQHADAIISDVASVDERCELVSKLRIFDPDRRVGVVAFSSQPSEESCQRALCAGYDEFIAKPCESAALLRAVKASCERKAP